jgi:hypothetical protein
VGTVGAADREPLPELEVRYRALAAELAAIGFVARGSVVAATTTCSTRGCHCRTDPARRHGPYWQWTRSVDGVTHTTRLSEAEAERYREWIANRRRAEAILAELEGLTLQAARSLPEPAERRRG